MSSPVEIHLLERFCVGSLGLNIGCGNLAIGSSIGVDFELTRNVNLAADATKLPFKSNSLDFIVSAAALEHMDVGPVTVLREWLRVLKPHGVLAVTVPDADYGMWAMTGDTGKVGTLQKPRPEMEHRHAFTVPTLRMLFEFAGTYGTVCKSISRQPYREEPVLLCVGNKAEWFK